MTYLETVKATLKTIEEVEAMSAEEREDYCDELDIAVKRADYSNVSKEDVDWAYARLHEVENLL